MICNLGRLHISLFAQPVTVLLVLIMENLKANTLPGKCICLAINLLQKFATADGAMHGLNGKNYSLTG